LFYYWVIILIKNLIFLNYYRSLLRHATAIENELNKTGLTTILIETLNEKNVYARRRAIAALGEFLFYAATQKDDE
jgi:hypothetical protein